MAMQSVVGTKPAGALAAGNVVLTSDGTTTIDLYTCYDKEDHLRSMR